MSKWIAFCSLLCGTVSSGCAFEKLPEEYRIRFGNAAAPVEITEYISLACPKCLDLFCKDFAFYQDEYLERGKASWIFHPHPADLSTLQAMVCLECLDEKEKPLFLKALLPLLHESKGEGSSEIMKAAMEAFKKPLPELGSLAFLQTTEAFEQAYRFLCQKDVPDALPSIEIEGDLIEAFPSRNIVQEQIEQRTT